MACFGSRWPVLESLGVGTLKHVKRLKSDNVLEVGPTSWVRRQVGALGPSSAGTRRIWSNQVRSGPQFGALGIGPREDRF